MQGTIKIAIKNTNTLCFVMKHVLTGERHQGPFMFAQPGEARDAKVQLEAEYPLYTVHLEDRQGNEIEIPKR